VRKRRKT